MIRRCGGPFTLVVGGLVVLFVLVPLAPALLGRGVLLDVGALSAYLPFRAEVGRDVASVITCRRDTFDFYLPGIAEIKRSLFAGHLPTWAPYEVGGAPLASLPNHGALSPMSLPYFLLPLWLAPAYVKLLECVVAIVGMVAFLRRLGLSTVAGLAAGVVFAGSGFMIMWANWPHTRVAALIPALFWALERLVQQVRARDVVLVGAVVASMLLGGFPAIVLFAHTLAAPYVLTRVLMLYRHRLRRAAQAMLAAVGGIMLGVGLSAIQVIPFAADLANLDFSTRDETGSHLPLSTAFTVIDPYAVGTCVGGRWLGQMIPIEAVGFIGAAAVPLAAAAIVLRRRAGTDRVPTTFFVIAAAVLGSAIWLGGPVLAALQLLPLWSTNFIGRAQSVFGFIAAVGVGVGVDRLLRGSPHDLGQTSPGGLLRGHPAWRMGLVATVLAAVAVVVTTAIIRESRDQAFADQVARTALVPVILVLVSSAAVLVAARSSGRTRLVGLGIALTLLVAQSTIFAHTLLPTSRRQDFYPETATHRYLAEHLGPDRYAAGGETMFPPTSDFYELRTPVGHEFTDQRWKDVLAAADPEVQRTATYSSFRPDLPVAEIGRSAPLDQLAVRYWVARPGQRVGRSDRLPTSGGEVPLPSGKVARCVLSGGPLRGIRVRLKEDIPTAAAGARPMLHVRVTSGGVEREGAVLIDSAIAAGVLTVSVAGEDLPADPAAQVRIWLTDTTGVRVFQGQEDLLACAAVRPVDDGLRLVHADAGGAVYERLTALPRVRWASTSRVVTDASARVAAVAKGLPAGTVLLEDGTAPEAAGRPAEVTVVEDERERITVRVDAQGAGYLVIADSIVRPGWRATVDGSPVAVRHGNHAFAAVAVPAGSHSVELTYQAPGLRLGMAVTAACVLLAAVPVVGPSLVRRRRRVQETPPGRLG